MAQNIFATPKNVYWPSEFSDIVAMLKGVDENGKPTHPSMYRFNTGAMVLAACIGLRNGRERDVGSARQEISTETFEGHKFGNTSLAAYLLLLPLLANKDIELLRPEREDEALRIFERYAAGGFEYLRGSISSSSDISGQSVISREINVVMKIHNDGSGDHVVDILG